MATIIIVTTTREKMVSHILLKKFFWYALSLGLPISASSSHVPSSPLPALTPGWPFPSEEGDGVEAAGVFCCISVREVEGSAPGEDALIVIAGSAIAGALAEFDGWTGGYAACACTAIRRIAKRAIMMLIRRRIGADFLNRMNVLFPLLFLMSTIISDSIFQ
jgi:hypothetical protein